MIVDVTVRLREGLPHWPGQDGFGREVASSTDAGDRSTVSTLTLGAHTGTHFDGPVHFLAGGPGIESLPLEALLGDCCVADLTQLEEHITAEALEAAGIPDGTTRLLAKTRNSGWSHDDAFREGFCAYDASAARWCVERGMVLVANDYLSIEPRGSGDIGNPTHKTLLGAGVVVLEGVDLEGVEPGAWELIALPIPVVGGDGAPGRVLLRR